MECLLCLKTCSDYIAEYSKEWSEFKVKNLVDKHLWAIQESTSPLCICMICWTELDRFNKFYACIEQAHNILKQAVAKPPSDPLDPFPQEVLLESEIDQAILFTADSNQGNELYLVHGDNQGLFDGNYDDETNEENAKNVSCNNVPANTNNECMDECMSDTSPVNFIIDAAKRNKADYDAFLKEHFKITCDKCYQTLETFALLAQHYSKSHNERGYVVCCETKFFYRHFLVDHIKYHLNPDYFKCTYCDKSFSTRRCLQIHIQLHEDRKHACDKCDKKYIKRYLLEKHKLTHMPKPEKKFSCNECGKLYVSQHALNYHEKAVHQNVYVRVCEVCGQTLPDAFSYKQHMLRHNPKPVKCEDCGLLVTSQITLKYHRDLKHPVGGSREYSCPICQRISPNMRAHKAHIKETHEAKQKFECTLCNKKFKRRDKLKCHMAVHTGNLSYSCSWCPKQFITSSNMTHHRKKVHPTEWEEEQRKKYSGNLPPRLQKCNSNNSS
ncbi:zinc finger protein 492-like [Stomoxys calcitrans]|uniref:zinc finger protein 492-like n=1 Tax=Stomoxys calcitrans TaxID=35570 RepID=UPI0027E2CB19|nr:zinc finger protein 492-like [Stomoxys calcitrans]